MSLPDAVKRADRNEIVRALAGTPSVLAANLSWLPPSHILGQGQVGRALPNATPTEMTQYIAASAPLHVMDGWRYLARAYGSLAAGDEHAATHLAYYAELRAAMAMMAAEGLGIFNGTNYAVTTGPQTVSFSGKTHKIAWQAMQEWAKSPASGVRLLDSLEVEGTPLTTWLTAATGRGPLQFGSIAEQWIKRWGLDLSVAARDSGRRNEATYNASGVVITPPPADSRVMQAFDGFWDAGGPGVHVGSAEIDYELLYRALQFPGSGRWASKLGQLAGAPAPRGGSLMSSQLEAWLRARPSEPDPWLLATATVVSTAVDALPLICRAALLLRLSSALIRKLFIDAGIAGTDLEPWWKAICSRHGFLPDSVVYSAPASSLITEVRAAQSALDPARWGPGIMASARETLEQLSYPLGQIDRTAAWLLEVA